MGHIKHSSMGVSLVVLLPLFWRGITCQTSGYSITVPPSVSVQEGLCVTIPCNFTADGTNRFTDSTGYWKRLPLHPSYIVATNNKSSDVKKTNFHLKGNPDMGDCTLTITDARREDTGTYYFRYEKNKDSPVKWNYIYETYTTPTITVTDLTEEPVISDLGSVIAGVDKTLTCSPPGNCPATSLVFQWKKSNVDGIWKNLSTITFTPSLEDNQRNITCEMTNSKGKTTQKSIRLDVHSASGAGDTISYRDIAIGIISVIIIITLIILLYKLRAMRKITKQKTGVKVNKLSTSTDPAKDEIYINVNKPELKAEETTYDNMQQDTSDATMDKDDVQYSTVAFNAKPSKVSSSSQPETLYAEVQKK